MQTFNKKFRKRQNIQLSSKQYLITMKPSITDFKTGMLQRVGGKERGKEERKPRNGGPCLIFLAHGMLNQEDHHGLEASVGYIVNLGQRDL